MLYVILCLPCSATNNNPLFCSRPICEQPQSLLFNQNLVQGCSQPRLSSLKASFLIQFIKFQLKINVNTITKMKQTDNKTKRSLVQSQNVRIQTSNKTFLSQRRQMSILLSKNMIQKQQKALKIFLRNGILISDFLTSKLIDIQLALNVNFTGAKKFSLRSKIFQSTSGCIRMRGSTIVHYAIDPLYLKEISKNIGSNFMTNRKKTLNFQKRV